MSLSCYVPEDYYGEGWYYYPPDDFTILRTLRRKRCCSCKKLIDYGSECLKFIRTREPRTDLEIKIYGDGEDSITLAPWYMCSACGEQFLNLNEYGYCIDIAENMFDLLKEHREINGIKIGD